MKPSEEKILKMLNEVEGKSTSRLLNIETIRYAIDLATIQLKKLKIPKKLWKGCVIWIYNEKLPNSYKYKTYGTEAKLEYKSDWTVVSVHRTQCSKTSFGADRGMVLILNDECLNYCRTIQL